MEHLFRGSALSTVDAKGRLSVPAFIRQKIERRSDEKVLVLRPHERFRCLIGYDTNYKSELTDRLPVEGPDPLATLDANASLYGLTSDVAYDPSGRIILPPRLKRRGDIAEFAMFVGMGETFMVWNPLRAMESGSQALADLAADLLEEKGVAL